MKKPVLLLAFVAYTSILSFTAASIVSYPDTPPYVVRLGGEAHAYLPGGLRFDLPAGTEIDACGPLPLVYDTSGRVLTIAEPCPQRPVFRNGFED